MQILVKDAEEEYLVHQILECIYYRNLDIWYSRLTRAQRKKADVLLSIMAIVEADDLGLGISTIEERELLLKAVKCVTLFDKSEFLLSLSEDELPIAKRLISLADIARLYSVTSSSSEFFSDAKEVIAKVKSKL